MTLLPCPIILTIIQYFLYFTLHFSGGFLRDWMKEIVGTAHIREFLELLVNVLKFNSSFIDEEIMAALVQ